MLKVALALAEQLATSGVEVVLTRAADTTTDLHARTDAAKAQDTHCLVSVHANASAPGNRTSSGVETYFDAQSGQAKALAHTVHQSYLKFAAGHQDRGIIGSPSTAYPRHLHVLRAAGRPAILVELEFISHPDQELWLLAPSTQFAAAFAICRGVLQWARSQPGFREVPFPADAVASGGNLS